MEEILGLGAPLYFGKYKAHNDAERFGQQPETRALTLHKTISKLEMRIANVFIIVVVQIIVI